MLTVVATNLSFQEASLDEKKYFNDLVITNVENRSAHNSGRSKHARDASELTHQ